jgi:hypothetical protein
MSAATNHADSTSAQASGDRPSQDMLHIGALFNDASWHNHQSNGMDQELNNLHAETMKSTNTGARDGKPPFHPTSNGAVNNDLRSPCGEASASGYTKHLQQPASAAAFVKPSMQRWHAATADEEPWSAPAHQSGGTRRYWKAD